MNLFVDTSVWSLALRRDAPPAMPAVTALSHALLAGDPLFTAGRTPLFKSERFRLTIAGPRTRARSGRLPEF